MSSGLKKLSIPFMGYRYQI